MTRRRRKPRAVIVVAASLATFLAVLALLAGQMRAGHDPALAGSRPALVSTTHGGSGQVVTRTSGGGVVVTPTAHGKAGTTQPIVTHTSGGGEHEDD